MKMIYTLAALAILATAPAHAAVKGCWQATGNWNGGESFTNCEGINDRHTPDPEAPAKTETGGDDHEDSAV